MTVINIGNRGDKIISYLKSISVLNTLFTWGIYFGKPIVEPTTWMYLYLHLQNNAQVKISSDNYGTYSKTAQFDFVIVGNDKAMPDVELYEALDLITNNIRTFGKSSITIDDFTIMNIEEGNQSGVIRTDKQNPRLIGEYYITYKYLYN